MNLTVGNKRRSDALRFLEKPRRLHFCGLAKLELVHCEVFQEPKIYPPCSRVVYRVHVEPFLLRWKVIFYQVELPYCNVHGMTNY